MVEWQAVERRMLDLEDGTEEVRGTHQEAIREELFGDKTDDNPSSPHELPLSLRSDFHLEINSENSNFDFRSGDSRDEEGNLYLGSELVALAEDLDSAGNPFEP